MSDVVSKKTVDEILEEINQIDIREIELDEKALKFLKTLEAYLHCFDELQALYETVDPTHQLANYDLSNPNLQIQQVSKTGEPVRNIAELYEVAEIMSPVFEGKINGLLEQVISSSPKGSSGVQFMLAPLKGMVRASEKAQDDYSKKSPGPAESWLYDIVRGSVLFDDAEQLFQFLEVLRADESIIIVKSKNRFRNPTLSGYRDFNMQIQITNDDDDDDGAKHICEHQLHITAIKEADTRLQSHSHYEFFREFYSGATESLEERMEDLRAICKGGSLDMTFLTNAIENPLLEVDQMTRLANLFAQYMNEYQIAIVITNAMKKIMEPQFWYTRLGNLLVSQDKLDEALVLHQTSLDIDLKELGPEHADVATSYHNMANVLVMQGKLEQAMTLYKKSLDIELKALGSEHTLVADTYNNMANVLYDQGKLEESIRLYQKALDIQVKALGLEHSKVADSYYNMANVFYFEGKLEEAMRLYEMALDIRLKALGPEHTDVAQVYNNMAIVMEKQGKLEEALELYHKSLDIRVKALGPDHTNVAASYNNIGYALLQQDRLAEALVECQKALDIQVKTLGEVHSSTANTIHSIGEILCKQGKLEEATQYGEKALKVFLEVCGPDHWLTAEGMKLMDTIHGKEKGA